MFHFQLQPEVVLPFIPTVRKTSKQAKILLAHSLATIMAAREQCLRGRKKIYRNKLKATLWIINVRHWRGQQTAERGLKVRILFKTQSIRKYLALHLKSLGREV